MKCAMKRTSKALRDLDADIFDERVLHASASKLLSRGATLGTPIALRHTREQSEISLDGGKSYSSLHGLPPVYDASGGKGDMGVMILIDGIWIGDGALTVQNGQAVSFGTGIFIGKDGSIRRYSGGSPASL